MAVRMGPMPGLVLDVAVALVGDHPRPEVAAAAEVAGDEREQCGDLGKRDEREDVVGLGLPHELAEVVGADLGIGSRNRERNTSMVRSSSQRKYGRPSAINQAIGWRGRKQERG